MPWGRPDSPPAGAELAAKDLRLIKKRRRGLCPGYALAGHSKRFYRGISDHKLVLSNKQTSKPPKGHADERTRDRQTRRTNEDKRKRPPTRKEDK
eukprot:982744-Prymnesium_polylepis.1